MASSGKLRFLWGSVLRLMDENSFYVLQLDSSDPSDIDSPETVDKTENKNCSIVQIGISINGQIHLLTGRL